METVFRILMFVFIVIAVAGLTVMIYGFATYGNIQTGQFEKKGVTKSESSSSDGISKSVKYENVKGVEYSHSFEYDIEDFWQKLREKDPATQKNALILFGGSAFIFFTFFAVGAGMIAHKNHFGWVFIVLVGAIFGYVIYEFVKRL